MHFLLLNAVLLFQVADEIRGVLDLVEEVLSTFGFNKYEVNLSTRPEKSVGK
jgi:threonyl-tRNA synthetase